MKRYLLALAFLATVFSGRAADIERIYLSTDRTCYVAGDLVWYSAFSLGGASTRSGSIYIELFSADGRAAQGKAAMVLGRGSGVLTLPASLPTGNYLLCAYSSQDDARQDILQGGKLISVFNGFSSSRVRSGVVIGEPQAARPAATGGEIRLTAGSARPGAEMSLEVDNAGEHAVSLSVSVYHEDALVPAQEKGIRDACVRASLEGAATEGDVIRARLAGPDRLAALGQNPYAIISSPGSVEDVYATRIRADGTIRYHTNNIYGHRDLVCEVGGLKEELDCHIELEPEFIGLASADIPVLTLSPSYEQSLLDRVAAIPSSRSAAADTLVEFLPKRETRLFAADDPECHRFHLADYTRMNTLHECIIEFIPELRWRREGIQVLKPGSRNALGGFVTDVLVMIDGVPVLDHAAVIELDANLLSDILVYPRSYSLGDRVFDAVVSLVTAQRNISAVKFPDSVRILDFEGTSYPLAYTKAPADGEKDLRQTVFWHPAVSVNAGETARLQVRMPSYPGRFRVVAEGLDAEGYPVRQETTFEVR